MPGYPHRRKQYASPYRRGSFVPQAGSTASPHVQEGAGSVVLSSFFERHSIKIHPGRLEVITGPMFSGKSEVLIRRLKRAQIARLARMRR